MTHRLDPLLRPRSLAVVGATPRAGAVGRTVLANLLHGGYPGTLYAVNPRYDTVLDVPCSPSLAALPEPVEHVVFAVADERIEAALAEAVEHGARAVTIMSSLVLADDRDPPLRERVATLCRRAGLLVCGGNGMGFYNFTDRIWACGFDTRPGHRAGGVTLISHSGSGMSGIVDPEGRLDFNLAVSTGQETTVAMDAYLDFALDQPETRVVGLFIETARNPDALLAAFDKARRKGIPVVALKVGRTPLSAELAVSHSGALAGSDASYDAVFDHYAVQRVRDMDELASTLILFAQPHPVGSGGLVTLHDSGGERQLLIDRAEDVGVPFARLGEETRARLDALLDPGLPAVNPLDAWSRGGPGSNEQMSACLATMMRDPEAALGAVIHDRGPDSSIYPEYVGYLRDAHLASGKPLCLVASRQGSGGDPLAVEVTREGFPVLDGVGPFLEGVKRLFAWRDARARPAVHPPPVPAAAGGWRAHIAAGAPVDEAGGLSLLADFGIAAAACTPAASEAEALAAAERLGYPVTVKTAEPGLAHKSDRGGVVLDVRDARALAHAYRALADRLGPRVLVATMAEPGVEMILGMVNDVQFGPMVMLGFGGVHAEVIGDVRFVMPPFDATVARRHVDALHLRPLLEGARGAPPADVDAFCEAAARLSVLASELGDVVREIDVNPVIVHARGCTAVDALVVPVTGGAGCRVAG